MVKVILLALLTIIPRAISALKTPLIGDLTNYQLVGKAVLAGKNPYTATNAYPYFPFWMWLEAATAWISKNSNLPFQLIIKIPLIIADTIITLLIFKIASKKKENSAFYLALLYALNPVSILITGFQGQFDQLALLALILSFIYIKLLKKKVAFLFLSLSIIIKNFPLILLPLFLGLVKKGLKEKINYLLLVFLPIAGIIAPFVIINPGSVIKQIFLYSGVTDYGVIAIIRAFFCFKNNGIFTPAPYSHYLLMISKIIFLTLYGLIITINLWQNKKRRLPLLEFTTFIFCLFYFVYGGISSQYLIWILPFLIMENNKQALLYSFFASSALLGFYSYFFPKMISWILPSFVLTPKQAAGIHFLTALCFWVFLGFLLIKKALKSKLFLTIKH
jgi:hypothetical protein